MKTIIVTDIGEVKVSPNTMAIRIRVESKAPTYKEALDLMNEQHNEIMNVFRKLKMNRSLVRLSALSTYTSTDHNNEKIVVVSQDLVYKDRIDIEQSRLLLHELRQVTDFVIDVDFYLKDQKPAEEQALVNAVNNATDKAKAMALASGVKLGHVLNMKTGSTPEIAVMRSNMQSTNSEQAKSVRVHQTVEITWQLD